jgi:hypothetical protein
MSFEAWNKQLRGPVNVAHFQLGHLASLQNHHSAHSITKTHCAQPWFQLIMKLRLTAASGRLWTKTWQSWTTRLNENDHTEGGMAKDVIAELTPFWQHQHRSVQHSPRPSQSRLLHTRGLWQEMLLYVTIIFQDLTSYQKYCHWNWLELDK